MCNIQGIRKWKTGKRISCSCCQSVDLLGAALTYEMSVFANDLVLKDKENHKLTYSASLAVEIIHPTPDVFVSLTSHRGAERNTT